MIPKHAELSQTEANKILKGGYRAIKNRLNKVIDPDDPEELDTALTEVYKLAINIVHGLRNHPSIDGFPLTLEMEYSYRLGQNDRRKNFPLNENHSEIAIIQAVYKMGYET